MLRKVMFYLIFITFLSVMIIPAEANAQEQLSIAEKKQMLTDVGRKNHIPPEILKAIAYKETGMMQFNEKGETIISPDGGIGMMQITLSDEEMRQKSIDKNRLMNDTKYNIEIGARILKEKWNYSFIPRINSYDERKLESWYFAVMAYNGLSKVNDPRYNLKAYQTGIYDLIANHSLVTLGDLPPFYADYRQDGTLFFPSDRLAITLPGANTPSTQLFNVGDRVYTGNIKARLREAPNTGGSYKELSPFTQLEIVSGPIEDANNPRNHFVFYEVKNGTVKGYIASSNLTTFQQPLKDSPQIELANTVFPINHREPVARLVIRRDTPIVREDGSQTYQFYRLEKRGEFTKVYNVVGEYYDIGGSPYRYYMKYEPGNSAYIGRVLIEKNLPLYLKDSSGSYTKTSLIKPKGDALRVYSYDDEWFNVGNEYYVKKDRDTKFYKGFVRFKEAAPVYSPDGKIHQTRKKGEQIRVYGIDGNKLDVGGGYYVVNDRSKVIYVIS